MSGPAVLSHKARRDLIEIADWISQDNPNAAEAFLDGVEALLARLGDFPESGAQRSELARAFRFAEVQGYPYVLAYDFSRRPPSVARILHMARDIRSVLGEV